MPPSPKPHVAAIQPVFHGGAAFQPNGSTSNWKTGVLDFSTCCNPYGPAATIRTAVNKSDAGHYPDPNSDCLIQSLAEKFGMPAGQLIAGSGSTELIRLATLAYFGPGDSVVIASPTYGEYELACNIVNAGAIKYDTKPEDDFRLDCTAFINFAREHEPAGIFLCNPNNPTGQYLDPITVNKILDSFPDTLVVLDEAYIAFTPTAWDSRKLLKRTNLFVIRSMTKDFALAGLRLGYGMASPEIILNLKKVRPPWNVSSVGQAAGIAALSSDSYLLKCTRRILESRDYLTRQLSALGYHIVPTQTNFFIFETEDAARFQKQLLKKGVLVRDCTSFGLPHHIRIAPSTMANCRKLIQATKEIKAVGQ
ncbi:MAG: histidinol-phosphate transaminase [Syntrophales bacterium]|nr:histidinol-phosphate transaminase [Syntrophales bacterium]